MGNTIPHRQIAEKLKMWRIEFETGDSITTEDEALAQLHREKGRMVIPIRPEETSERVEPESNRSPS